MPCKGSDCACLDCIWKPGETRNLKVRMYLWARSMCIVLRWCRKAKEREFALNMQLETEDKSEKKVPCRAPTHHYMGQEIGSHGRIISQRAGLDCGIYSCQLQCEQPSILDKITLRTQQSSNTCMWDREFMQRYWEIGVGKFWRDPGCEGHRQQWPVMDTNNKISSTGDQVDKGKKGPHFLRLGLVSGKNVCTSKSSRKVERAADRLQTTVSNQELFGVDGEPIEFEWNIIRGLPSLEMFRKIQNDEQSRNITPENNFGDRIIFMSMFQRHWLKE